MYCYVVPTLKGSLLLLIILSFLLPSVRSTDRHVLLISASSKDLSDSIFIGSVTLTLQALFKSMLVCLEVSTEMTNVTDVQPAPSLIITPLHCPSTSKLVDSLASSNWSIPVLASNSMFNSTNPNVFYTTQHISLLLQRSISLYQVAGAKTVLVITCLNENLSFIKKLQLKNTNKVTTITHCGASVTAMRRNYLRKVVEPNPDLVVFLITDSDSVRFLQVACELNHQPKSVLFYFGTEIPAFLSNSNLIHHAGFVRPHYSPLLLHASSTVKGLFAPPLSPNDQLYSPAMDAAYTVSLVVEQVIKQNSSVTAEGSLSVDELDLLSVANISLFDSTRRLIPFGSPVLFQYINAHLHPVSSSSSLIYPSFGKLGDESLWKHRLSTWGIHCGLSVIALISIGIWIQRTRSNAIHTATLSSIPVHSGCAVFFRCTDVHVLFETLPLYIVEQSISLLHSVIVNSVTERNGFVVKFFGPDSANCLAIFNSAWEALLAAMDTQIDLLLQDWPDDILEMNATSKERFAPGDARILFRGLCVAIGLDYGTVSQVRSEEFGTDYAGTTLNRAARLCQSAVGGQTICSDNVFNFIRHGGHDTEDIVVVHNIGERVLKGLKEFTVFDVRPLALKDRDFGQSPSVQRKMELWSAPS
ncbi:hypothetical protein P9112_006843 [Eukaryota sp. TZLM1-RC]